MYVDLERVDVELLAKQRASLRQVIDEAVVTTMEQSLHLDGINNLLDHIYDQLVPVTDEVDP